MNKIIKYILCAFIITASASCAEDKGNYEYTKINTIEISGIDRQQYVTVGNDFQITPKFTFSKTANEENLSYSWKINNVEVSKTRNLDYNISNTMGFGEKNCVYTITDENNGMKYASEFKVTIMNPFNWGYYFLTRKSDNATELAFLSVINDNKSFAYADGVGQIPFGKDPISISGGGGNVRIENVVTYCFTFDVMTKEGEFPIISSETATFYPSATINEQKYFDKDLGLKFHPTSRVAMRREGDIFYCNDGALTAYVKGILYYPSSTHNSRYRWSNPIQCFSGGRLVYALDENTKKYFVAKPEITNASTGVISDNLLLDRVVPIEDFPSLEGHTIIKTASGPNAPLNKPSILTVHNGKLNQIEFEYWTSAYGNENFEKGKYTNTTAIDLAGISSKSKVAETEKDFYISVGNKIYIAPKERISEIREFATIDSKHGEITSMEFSTQKMKLVVSAYNKNSSSERKGSVTFIDSSSGIIVDEYPNSINECVSILSANFYYIYGKKE